MAITPKGKRREEGRDAARRASKALGRLQGTLRTTPTGSAVAARSHFSNAARMLGGFGRMSNFDALAIGLIDRENERRRLISQPAEQIAMGNIDPQNIVGTTEMHDIKVFLKKNQGKRSDEARIDAVNKAASTANRLSSTIASANARRIAGTSGARAITAADAARQSLSNEQNQRVGRGRVLRRIY